MTEYAELVSLTSGIREQDKTSFKEEWKMFVDNMKNYCKQVKQLVGLE